MLAFRLRVSCTVFLLGSFLPARTATGQTTANWTQQSPKTSPSARAFHAMAYDSTRGQVVMFGGLGANFLNETWVWDGTNWTQKSPQTSPPPRGYMTMAFDSVRGQVVMFGGLAASYLGDTWVWDGANWTEKVVQNGPEAREGQGMAFDAGYGQVVLFGGYDAAGNFLGDTWVWDGSKWTQKSPATSPSARVRPALVYDSIRGQVVMFGDATPADTWVWDGSNWTKETPKTMPQPRDGAAFAFDSSHGQGVLFGGGFGDTWLWDGANWTQDVPMTSPPVIKYCSMTYDASHGQVVLFGGAASVGGNLNQTWTWNGGSAGLLPSVTAVVSAGAYGGFSTVAPGSWVEIYGSNLASTTRGWSGSDFIGNDAPTVLDGVQVNIGGQKAFVDYVSASPGQINAQLPSNIATGGTLQLTVTNGQSTGAPYNVTVAATEPGLLAPAAFQIGGKQYVVALLSDGVTYVLPTGAIPGVLSRPAQPGETITMYGIGFGSVTPDSPAGQIVPANNNLLLPFQILFGQTPARTPYAGLAPGLVGLYQFNVVVPAVADNDLAPIGFTLGGAPGTQSLYTAVHQ